MTIVLAYIFVEHLGKRTEEDMDISGFLLALALILLHVITDR